MIFVPLSVLVTIVMYVTGGPARFVSIVAMWASDVAAAVVHWARYL